MDSKRDGIASRRGKREAEHVVPEYILTPSQEHISDVLADVVTHPFK